MQKVGSKQSKDTNNSAPPTKKPFIAPRLERLDTALTQSGVGSADGSDFSTYQS